MLSASPSHRPPQRKPEYYRNGRTAFRTFLERQAGQRILLPAYVGWSPREGSGVFDPVRETGRQAVFYRVDHRLRVDVDDFRAALQRDRPAGVVLIHYFGFVDPSYPVLVGMAHDHGSWVVEDEAHALLTDLVAGTTGRLGDAAIWSLHKMLPLEEGGALVTREGGAVGPSRGEPIPADRLWAFDLASMARRRRENAAVWLEALRPLAEWLRPLWGPPGEAEIPQTLPMIVHGVSRDALYHELNAVGVGVVSLYHTLIEALPRDEYPVSHDLSRTITNFPVHPEVTQSEIREAVPLVERAIKKILGAP